jgi:hypothetical protein
MDEDACREAEVEPSISERQFSSGGRDGADVGDAIPQPGECLPVDVHTVCIPWCQMWRDPLEVRANVAANLENTPDRVLRQQRVPERLPPGPGLGVALRVGVTELAAPQALESCGFGRFGARITRYGCTSIGRAREGTFTG